MSYESLVAIVLSALSIGITILSVVIAVAAAWGFRRIKHDAEESATNAAREMLCAYVGSPEWKNYIKEEISRRLDCEAERLFRELSMAIAFSSRGSDHDGEVGKLYPETEDPHVIS